jgi:hypothetical protein
MKTHRRLLGILTTLFTLSLIATGSAAPKPGPTNTSPPTLSGSTVAGQTLTANPGSWSGPSSQFSFSWQRCDSALANCATYPVATSTYALTSSDVGSTIRVIVTATSRFGSTTATSAPTALITATAAPAPTWAPQNTSLPTVSGQPLVGATLTASAGSWTGTAPISYSYRWDRCAGACTAILGATSTTYVAGLADVGATLQMVVQASNTVGGSSAASSPTAAVSGSTADTTSPTTPANLSISATSPTGLALTWLPSTDNVGVAVYRAYVNGTYNGETTLTSYAFSGFACGTSYTLGVEAVDAAGNRSERASLSGSTSACATTTSCVSGECLPVGDLPGWQQVFTDDFSTNAPLGSFSGCTTNGFTCSGLPQAVRDKWFAYPDGWSDSKSGTYAPSKVMSIQNGLMNLYLHSENGAHLVSAPMPKIPGTSAKLGMTYGRYAARLRADSLHGYETAWLLWPDSEVWPRDGEIDLPEGYLDSYMCMFLHHQGGTSAGDQDGWCSTTTYTNWHTIVLEWAPSVANFYIDGKLIMASTSRIPNTPMHWVLQTDTAPCCAPDNTTAGNLQIDWVAVWKRV